MTPLQKFRSKRFKMLLTFNTDGIRTLKMERAPQQQHHHNQQQQQQFQFREPQQQQHQPVQQQLEVTIRRVGIEDHMNIIKLFQVKNSSWSCSSS